MYKTFKIIILLIAISFNTGALFIPNCDTLYREIRYQINDNTTQFIFVKPMLNSNAKVIGCERINHYWQQAFNYKAFIGENGIANLGDKREGDGKTPAGIYPFGKAFGFGINPTAYKLNFIMLNPRDKFIDDPESPDYNTFIRGQTQALSYENMYVPHYKKGIIINYNMKPVIKYHGSAIFMHIIQRNKNSTKGCIALEEDKLNKILKWLQSDEKPYIFIANP